MPSIIKTRKLFVIILAAGAENRLISRLYHAFEWGVRLRNRIEKCIRNDFERKYIFPFFWLHGENHALIEEEIDAIHSCGITQFCAESRVHKDFCGDTWWEDFGFILKCAEKRNMKVWLLDDKHFPTGYANNYIEKFPEFRKASLRIEYRDFAGPSNGCSVIVPEVEKEEEIIGISAWKRSKNGNILDGEPIDLTSSERDGLIYLDIPAGILRVYYIIKTHRSVKGKENYIDVLSKQSCSAMIKAVYDPHFEHFGRYFGNTFAGFFSDEPGFNNEFGCYDSKLGKEDMLIPWNAELLNRLADDLSLTPDKILAYLPSLWHETEKTSIVRQAYMEAVSKLFGENFSCQLGDWCRKHNCMYIGHIIEDMNAHMRLGHGAGHYFRALDGQDYAGIDVVLHQIIPGINELDHTACVFGNRADTTFYDYALAKLASSHAHLQPLKKNRAMCEIFGAYGWAEGLTMQKRLADHMLVRGINYFVPHAFNPKYPDSDCPPFFYARGQNPQFKLFPKLIDYMQRCCCLLSGGKLYAEVAVLYNAEAEWAGGKYLLFQEIAKELMQNQIDFDFIYEDVLYSADISEKRLVINNRKYSAVIVPYSEILPEKLIKALGRLCESGIAVAFTDAFPAASSEKTNIDGMLNCCSIISRDEITAYLKKHSVHSSIYGKKEKDFRVMRNDYSDGKVYMLVNESSAETIDTYITVGTTDCCFYDAWKNTFYKPDIFENKVRIKLEPCQSLFLIENFCCESAASFMYGKKSIPAALEYDIYTNENAESTYRFLDKTQKLSSITSYQGMSRFCGIIKYETEFLSKPGLYGINLGNIGETATVWLNGECCGVEICAPYVFLFGNALKDGKNKLTIEVINNPAYRERDTFSTYLPLPPSGIIGPVEFIFIDEDIPEAPQHLQR